MHLQNQYLLITSVPVKLRGQDYALELIKDITDTFMLPDVAGYDNIRVIELVERFNNLAVHDTFTALYNKTYVMTQLHEMLMRCKELGEQPSADVVMLDLDLFKDVNDEHGHVVGDDVLLSFALQLKHIAHGWKDGWAARYGGDEFILCAPHGMGDDGMHQIAEGIASFESDVSQHVEGAPRVSVSYGVARMRLDDTAKSLIDRADDEMYVMKARHHAELGVSDR